MGAQENKSIIALIVAAGRGARAGEGGPKQYRPLGGVPVLQHSVRTFLSHPRVDAVRVVIHADDRGMYEDALGALSEDTTLLAPTIGGAERQDSVRIGLQSLSDDAPTIVLIHDAARPFISTSVIDRVIDGIENESSTHGAIAALPVYDTIKKENPNSQYREILETVPRQTLWRAQTPQGFVFGDILAAHERAKGTTLTDDAAVAEAAGLRIQLVTGSPDNMKITQAEDFGMAETLLGRNAIDYEFRTGHGYDVHEFEDGDATILCGVSIPHTAKLKGHSDADAGLHALTDAILGAVGEGDIGDHFPPSDPQWKGAPSHIFLEKARDIITEKGGTIVNCDITFICERPKIGPHRDAMRVSVSELLHIAKDRVSVKATTSEKLGFTGREEGIAAIATATIRLPMEA